RASLSVIAPTSSSTSHTGEVIPRKALTRDASTSGGTGPGWRRRSARIVTPLASSASTSAVHSTQGSLSYRSAVTHAIRGTASAIPDRRLVLPAPAGAL